MLEAIFNDIIDGLFDGLETGTRAVVWLTGVVTPFVVVYYIFKILGVM